MAGSGGSIKELANRYNSLRNPVYRFGQDLTALKKYVDAMNKNYWNGGSTANKWYDAVKKAHKVDRNFYNKMLKVQYKLEKKLNNLAKSAGVNITVGKQSGSGINSEINLVVTSTDDIFIDGDYILTYSKSVKTTLTNMCSELKTMKSNLDALVNNPKIKGKLRKTMQKLANGVNKKYNKTNAAKNSLESSLSKSIAEYQEAMNSFDELDSMAEDLGND